MPEKSNDAEEIESDLYSLNLKSRVNTLSEEINVCLSKNSSQVCSKACLESYSELETVSVGQKASHFTLNQTTSNQEQNISNDQNHVKIFNISNQHYVKKDFRELESYSLSEIKILAKELSKAVEDVSSQLVILLQENDALQQESDARNIAIEQLLRLTVKETENELKPIQMSVILSDEDI